jgi:hypothetical protein
MQPRRESSRSGNTTPHHQNQTPRHVELNATKYVQQHPEAPIERGRVLIDVDALGDKFEEEFFWDVVPSRPIASPRRSVQLRNSPIAPPWVKEESVRHGNSTLKVGKTVELQDGHFLFIIDVIKNLQSDVVKLRGWQLKRCSDMDGLLRRGLNELCFIFEVELDDPRPGHEQAMIEAELNLVVKVRKLIRTNYPFPYLRYSDPITVSNDKAENKQFLRDNEQLVVRWKYTTKYANRAERLRVLTYPTNIVQKRMESLTEQECTEGYYLDPLVSRSLWREETVLGGSGMKKAHVSRQSGISRRATTKAKNLDLVCPWCDEIFHPQDVEVMFEHCQVVHRLQEKTSLNYRGELRGLGTNMASQFHPSKSLSGAHDTSTNTQTHNSKSGSLRDNLPQFASDLRLSSSGQKQMYTFADACTFMIQI